MEFIVNQEASGVSLTGEVFEPSASITVVAETSRTTYYKHQKAIVESFENSQEAIELAGW